MSLIITDADGVEIETLAPRVAVLLDKMDATLPYLDLRMELHCRQCAEHLGYQVRQGKPDPFLRLDRVEHDDGTMTLKVECFHSTRLWRGRFEPQPAAIHKKPPFIDDGSGGGMPSVRLPRAARDLIVETDLALRAINCRMHLICTVCEDAGEPHKNAQGSNSRMGSFTVNCRHVTRVCAQ